MDKKLIIVLEFFSKYFFFKKNKKTRKRIQLIITSISTNLHESRREIPRCQLRGCSPRGVL